MQITDQQFISAMEQAVKDKGPFHSAPGSYWNASSGEAYCIVGYALSLIDQHLCPHDNSQMANTLLPALGCSSKVGDAAYAAQGLNDRNVGWEQVLDAFKYGMQVWHEDLPLPVLFNMVQDHWRSRQLQSLTKSTAKAAKALGGLGEAASKVTITPLPATCAAGTCGCSTTFGSITFSAKSTQMFATLTADFSIEAEDKALISA